MKKLETTATTGFIEVCGKCNVPLKVHPVRHCPYLYKAVRNGKRGRIFGYRMLRRDT